ncbi:MAG: hypothetical protein AVDCRST_MAG93-8751 [uncultured Chloroflexia bacterium]|uniref:Uncharacterized protein n=1 Tax=uncultured Chloroflexia bacterium TaxID=1672391 RepID=A0A6J4N5X2_9CHLR|nr:MAG: hypothetical protein AVDCRST_MAG93-8751 [uncultured Chloroflexia bacterium]
MLGDDPNSSVLCVEQLVGASAATWHNLTVVHEAWRSLASGCRALPFEFGKDSQV